MKCPSFTLILSGVFIAYVLHSMWSLAQLFVPPSCNKEPCFKSYLMMQPQLDLFTYTSETKKPSPQSVLTLHERNFDYDTNFNKYVDKYIYCFIFVLNVFLLQRINYRCTSKNKK